jgi:predicted DNA-binding transcriptional regulator YafY
MRFRKAEDLLDLAITMQGTREGLSLQDVQSRYSVSRRTAERMRDAVERIFPQLEEANPGDRPKRWRLPPGVLNRIVNFTAEELVRLEGAADVLARDNRQYDADKVRKLGAKVRALMTREAMQREEVDLEALLEAEGLAMRPGPRPVIRDDVLVTLRYAVNACRKVRLHYRGRDSKKFSRQIVCPYGFLYGNRHYLVAYSMGMRDYRLYSLSNIKKVESTEWPFARRDDFSLEAYAEHSFGVFQEEPFDVVWKFTPAVAADAREFLFHPSQSMEDMPDGSLLVRFRAGGAQEMSWHLYTWGDAVEVMEPKDFWARLQTLNEVPS